MIETQKVAELLGGSKVFSHLVSTELEFFDEVSKGFPLHALERILKLQLLSNVEVAHLVVSARTLARRKKEHHLSTEESDRLARVARIIAYTQEVMGNSEKANLWLRHPNHALQDRIPLDLLTTDSGARIVETILGRIEQGIYS